MQSRVKLALLSILWCAAVLSTHGASDSGLPDFEMDDGKDEADDYYYVNDGSDQQMQPSHKIISYAKPPPPEPAEPTTPDRLPQDALEPFLMEDDDTSFEMMDDVEFVEQGTMDIQRKAERMKRIMLKAFANREFQRKFGEVLPLLKVMSKTQKSTLAALITAQVNSREGHTLSLEQVKSMFGNRPELILPLVYDIANMIRTVAKKESLLFEQQQQQQHDLELPGDDEGPLEDEGILSNHLLRRSFSIRSEPHGFRTMHEQSVPAAAASNLQDGRLMVDMPDEAEVRPLAANDSDTARAARNEPVPFFEKLVQALPRFNIQRTHDKSDDRMTYHERKLNMTAFNASGSQKDQLAMASDGPIPVTLPKVSPRQPAPVSPITHTETTTALAPTSAEPTLTLEQIEDLAFAGLNGTEADATGGTGATPGNASATGGPVAEMLIGGRQRPQGMHALLPSENCEYFSGGVCIRVANYPTSEIMYSITRHRHAIGALLAEYIDKASAQDRNAYEPDEIEQGINTKLRKREDDPSKSGGSMCPSIIRYARPQKARSATGEWKYIVNTGEHTQTLRLEKCSTPQDSCTYLTDNFRSRCVQIYNYHRLLSWDAARGLHVDIFKVPTCCSCHIDGYRETFPPLTSYNDFKSKIHEDPHESASTLIRANTPHHHQHHQHSPAHHAGHYSTLQFDQVDEDESDDNIAYQFSNGFQRVKPPKYEGALHLPPAVPPPPAPAKTRFERPSAGGKHPGVAKPKLPHFIPPPTLDTYLSPPPNDLAYGIPFKRSGPHYNPPENALKRAGSVGGNRRPLRKTIAGVHSASDQSIAETDSRLNQVAVLPPSSKLDQLPQTQAQTIIERHRRRQQTTPQTPLTTMQQQQQQQYSHQQQQHQQQQQQQHIYRVSHPQVTPAVAPINPTVPLSTVPETQPPSTVSTTTTAAATNGHQRINYNYHPIIDFFEEAHEEEEEGEGQTIGDSTQEQIDRIGLNSHSSLNSWKPVINGRTRFH